MITLSHYSLQLLLVALAFNITVFKVKYKLVFKFIVEMLFHTSHIGRP